MKQEILMKMTSKPLDLSKIRVDTKNYSVKQLVSMIEEGYIELIQDYDDEFRQGDVDKYHWNSLVKSSFIQSIFLDIPTPSVYLVEDPNSHLQVIDGLDRLHALYEFVHEQTLRLQGIKYLDLSGKRFDDLPVRLQARFNLMTITTHIVDQRTPFEIKEWIFLKIREGQPWNDDRWARTLAVEPTRNNP
jgi:hypothetical protein